MLNPHTRLIKGLAVLALWAGAHIAPANATRVPSSERGTVTEVREQKVKGDGSGLGMIAGGLVGGLVGNQVGSGSAKTIATVGGAVAGGYVGNEIEKSQKKRVVYRTKVRLDNGQLREYRLGERYRVGQRVRLNGDGVEEFGRRR
ncbi:MAG: glycine zipper 2TM domain-containing protein [Rubrivivax sp.]|nr:MAG: glycine zipper 2TM domain-containing protein [Rubrivivax sp.]